MLSTVFLLGALASVAFAGSLCPPRENIYPCSCINVPLGKNLFSTSVYCYRLPSTDSLKYIFPALRTMQIDFFHLYDSFWEAHKLEKAGEDQKVLPTDWLTLLKIKEIEIVDTTLSDCFACQSKLSCRNTVTQRFTAVNSSSHDKICTLCDTGRGNKFSWASCMSRLRHFHFSYGKINTLDAHFFAQKMNEMTILNMTYNEISIIEPKAFINLQRLKILDLSHNQIAYLENIFSAQMNLEVLDVSWNSIQTLGNNFFRNIPRLKTFKVDNNLIVDLKKSQWENVPDSLRNIDLSDNQLHCDCGITWINETFHVNVVILGRCVSPEEYENSLLRKASRFLKERCVGSSIGTRYRTRATPSLLLLPTVA